MLGMKMKTNEVQAIGTFLCDYATTLLERGATTVRIEKNVWRMAESYGFEAEVNIYPMSFSVTRRQEALPSLARRLKEVLITTRQLRS